MMDSIFRIKSSVMVDKTEISRSNFETFASPLDISVEFFKVLGIYMAEEEGRKIGDSTLVSVVLDESNNRRIKIYPNNSLPSNIAIFVKSERRGMQDNYKILKKEPLEYFDALVIRFKINTFDIDISIESYNSGIRRLGDGLFSLSLAELRGINKDLELKRGACERGIDALEKRLKKCPKLIDPFEEEFRSITLNPQREEIRLDYLDRSKIAIKSESEKRTNQLNTAFIQENTSLTASILGDDNIGNILNGIDEDSTSKEDEDEDQSLAVNVSGRTMVRRIFRNSHEDFRPQVFQQNYEMEEDAINRTARNQQQVNKRLRKIISDKRTGKTSTQKKTDRKESGEEININCCICYSKRINLTLADEIEVKGVLPCAHEYCFKCIEDWAKVTNTCPLCKERFNTIQKFEKGKKRCRIIKIDDKIIDADEFDQDSELNNADDYCYACRLSDRTNEMLVCDNCVTKCCHLSCLRPVLEMIPAESWYCDFCVHFNHVNTSLPTARLTSREIQALARDEYPQIPNMRARQSIDQAGMSPIQNNPPSEISEQIEEVRLTGGIFGSFEEIDRHLETYHRNPTRENGRNNLRSEATRNSNQQRNTSPEERDSLNNFIVYDEDVDQEEDPWQDEFEVLRDNLRRRPAESRIRTQQRLGINSQRQLNRSLETISDEETYF